MDNKESSVIWRNKAMADEVRDAAAGAALGELFKGSAQVIMHVTKRSIHFESYLEGLKSTLSKLKVLQEDIRQSREGFRRSPREEILDELVKKGDKLEKKCSKLKWWQQIIRFVYADKLWKLDKELLQFLQKDNMRQIMRDLSETVKLVIEIRERVNPTETSSDTGEEEGPVFDGDPDDAATASRAGSTSSGGIKI